MNPTAAVPQLLAPIFARIGIAIALFLGCFLATGCTGEAPSPRADGKKKVVTTFTVLADMTQRVAGDKVVVESITKPGAEIHDYEPTPRDVVKAQSADLVIRNGMDLERWFEKFITNLNNVPSVDLSTGITPINIGTGPYDGKPNPHSWMSPANALIYVENIRKALVQIDPANEATFNANAKQYSDDIRKIDELLRAELAKIPENQRWLVTSEGAFSYLAKDYGLKEFFLWPVNADQEGTPKQVKAVVDTVKANQIPVVFSESTISDKPMKQVAIETGARFGGLLYVDSLTDDTGPAPTYLKLLEVNAKTIVDAFGAK
jgi:manganese/iron transport system substrate-binding protein